MDTNILVTHPLPPPKSWRGSEIDKYIPIDKLILKKSQECWNDLHFNVNTFDQLVQWIKTIPDFGCNCSDHVKTYMKEHLPPEKDLFDWGVGLHNSVNTKLFKPTYTLEQARHAYQKTIPVYKKREHPIVSSVSPKKPKRQYECIESWLVSGFHVILIQNEDEVGKCKEVYDLPVEWRTCSTPRPTILEMLHTGIILNSDCEVSGEGPEFGDVPTGLLRWNFEQGKPAREEEWGIDCWFIPKPYLKYIPDDLPYMIGKPFWDYAVPAFFQYNNQPIKIDHTPWILHELHPLNWSQDDWMIGYKYISAKLPGREYGTAEFRRSIDTLKYNERSGIYV